MNVENILKVATAIEQHSIPDLGFNMDYYLDEANEDFPDRSGHNCGTVACIAGWAAAVKSCTVPDTAIGVMENALDFLGLDFPLGRRLFNPDTTDGWNSGPGQAARVLRHLAATGEVDWSLATSPAS